MIFMPYISYSFGGFSTFRCSLPLWIPCQIPHDDLWYDIHLTSLSHDLLAGIFVHLDVPLGHL